MSEKITGISSATKLRDGELGDSDKEHLELEGSLALYKAALSNKGIQRVLDTAMEVLGNPVIFVDNKLRMLGHAEPEGFDDPLFTEVFLTGDQCSPDLMRKTIQPDTTDYVKVFYSEKAEILHDDFLKWRYISLGVRRNEQPIGFCSVTEACRKFQGFEPTIIENLRNILSHASSMENATSETDQPQYDLFIENILSNTIGKEDIERRCAQLGLASNQPRRCIVARSTNLRQNKQLYIPYVKERIRAAVPSCICMSFGSEFVILVDEPEIRERQHDITVTAEKVLKENNLIGGVSKSFQTLADLPRAHREACVAIAEGRRTGDGETLFDFNKYGYHRLLRVASENIALESVLDSGYLTIRSYDQLHQTELLETLRVYLNCCHNAATAAKQMNVHRNTVDYRIERACLLSGLDLKDEETQFRLLLSYRIDDYLRRME